MASYCSIEELWIPTPACDPRAYCVPFNETNGLCSCEYSFMMFEDGPNGCVPSYNSKIFAAYWIMISSLTFLSGTACAAFMCLALHRRKLKKDAMTLTGAMLVLSCMGSGLSKSFLARSCLTASPNEYLELVYNSAMADILAFFGYLGFLGAFALNVIFALFRNLEQIDGHEPRPSDLCRIVVLSVACAVFFASIFAALLIYNQWVIAYLLASVDLVLWIAFWIACSFLLWRLEKKLLAARKSGTQVQFTMVKVMGRIKDSLLLFIVVEGLSTALYSVGVQLGIKYDSPMLLGLVSSLGFCFLFAAVMSLFCFMSYTVCQFFRARLEAQEHLAADDKMKTLTALATPSFVRQDSAFEFFAFLALRITEDNSDETPSEPHRHVIYPSGNRVTPPDHNILEHDPESTPV